MRIRRTANLPAARVSRMLCLYWTLRRSCSRRGCRSSACRRAVGQAACSSDNACASRTVSCTVSGRCCEGDADRNRHGVPLKERPRAGGHRPCAQVQIRVVSAAATRKRDVESNLNAMLAVLGRSLRKSSQWQGPGRAASRRIRASEYQQCAGYPWRPCASLS